MSSQDTSPQDPTPTIPIPKIPSLPRIATSVHPEEVSQTPMNSPETPSFTSEISPSELDIILSAAKRRTFPDASQQDRFLQFVNEEYAKERSFNSEAQQLGFKSKCDYPIFLGKTFECVDDELEVTLECLFWDMVELERVGEEEARDEQKGQEVDDGTESKVSGGDFEAGMMNYSGDTLDVAEDEDKYDEISTSSDCTEHVTPQNSF